ncbi:MAG TPA: hypothetical protein VNB29_06330 [Chthoniobacterales bacterium]|nr:hypothetical protein [Chthoniobacterales bacterium]
MDTFTLIHVLISLAGIAAGFVVLGGWLCARHLRGWTALFLFMTAATSITGFFFPFKEVTPGIVVGALSLVVLAIALFALVVKKALGGWETVYVIAATVALFFNFFVLIAQSFQHTPALKALAPTQSEPPFAIAQLLVVTLFIILGIGAVRTMRAARLSKG